jgi:hypothetical protein
LDAEALELVVKAIQVIFQERHPELAETNTQTGHINRIGIGANGSYGYIESKFING